MWNKLGPLPDPTEIEVTIMGPGHGEAIVVHLGNGEWLLVDSCVDASDDKQGPAPLRYLRALGVPVGTAVKLIVVSHWDDDHARGIADIVQECSSARFCCPTALTTREFFSLVESISIGARGTDGGNVGNFQRVLHLLRARGQNILSATPGRSLFSNPKITSWSPSDHEIMLFLQFVAQTHPQARQTHRKAIPGSPNLTSVVLGIDWNDTSILLGADMEAHSDSRRGWSAIVQEAKRLGIVRGDVVKIPHHGSHTGHDNRMWSDLLHPQPISVIAPFGRGPIEKRPPTSSDMRRINQLSSATFVTAQRSQIRLPKMDLAVTRSLREQMINISSRKNPLGIVRLRRHPGGHWRHTLLGPAIRAK